MIDPTLNHGRPGTYTNHGCRCDECKEANAVRGKAARESRKRALEMNPDAVEHGKYTTYCNWGCRCTECRAAHAEETKRKYHQRRARRG